MRPLPGDLTLETMPNGERTLYMVLWLDPARGRTKKFHAGGVMFERPRGQAHIQNTVWDESDEWTTLVVHWDGRTT